MKKNCLVFLLLAIIIPVFSQNAQPEFNWTRVHPAAYEEWYTDIAYGNGRFVAVGGEGILRISPNGINWTSCKNPANVTFQRVAYGNSKFVALAWGGAVYISADGKNWTLSGGDLSSYDIVRIKFCGDLFIALADRRWIITSPDGINWTPHNLGIGNQLTDVAYGGGLYVIPARSHIITSTDGSNWIIQGTVSQSLSAITYGNSLFVAWSRDLWGMAFTSTDGINWTEAPPMYARIYSVIYANGKFVAAGEGLYYSEDGVNWSGQYLDYNRTISKVVYGESTFAAIGSSGCLFTSGDGVDWTLRTPEPRENLWGVAYSGDLYVAVGNSGVILTSGGGRNWKQRQSPTTNDLKYVAYLNGLYIAVGKMGAIITSTDGIHWQQQESGTESDLNSVAYGNSRFVIVGNSTVATSTDGVKWEVIPDFWPGDLRGVTFADSIFVAVGGDELIMVSPDGINWTFVQGMGNREEYLNDIVYADGRFVAVSKGFFEMSLDGYNWWVVRFKDEIPVFQGITYANGSYIAVGQSMSCMNAVTSTDGRKWEYNPPNRSACSHLFRVTNGNSALIAVGWGGTILRAEYKEKD